MQDRAAELTVASSSSSSSSSEVIAREIGSFLPEIAHLLAAKLEPESLFEMIARVLSRLLHIDRASLTLYDPDRDEFEIVALAPPAGSRIGKECFIPHRGSRVGKAFDCGQPYYSTIEPGNRFFEDEPLVREGMHMSSSIPLMVDGNRIGTFNLNRRQEKVFEHEQIGWLTGIADQIAIAVMNSRTSSKLRIQKEALTRQNEYLLELSNQKSNTDLLLLCPSMQSWRERLITTARVDATVLISGETGTGKAVLARAIHDWSARSDGMFVVCDCAALTPSLIESELFGHEKGAFTGANSRRLGRFELAHGGTLFLDEIAEMPPEIQVKLLGALQERQIYRVGGNHPIHVDIRVIAATNKDLRAEVKAGRFRQDLFYRLNVVTLELPPLRERIDDLLPLAQHFIEVYGRKFGRDVSSLSAAACKTIQGYSWPGNIRELENVIERALVVSDSPALEISREMIGPIIETSVKRPNTDSSRLTLGQLEERYIRETLSEAGWRIAGSKGAAEALGLHPNTLRSRMARLKIKQPRRQSL